MEQSSGSTGGRGKNKRFWSSQEDKALITALQELAADPHWKGEGGFKSGYMTRLEEMISKTIPGCGIKAFPHIDSRMKTLLGKFRAICEMLGTSGFKWDDERKMISVERAVYDDYCKHHANARNLYGVSFPHFHEMAEIYGNDYATGKSVETIQDAIHNMEKEGDTTINVDSIDDTDIDASIDGTQSAAESAPPSKKAKKEKTPKRKESKKVTDSTPGADLACLQTFMENMNVHLSTMANAWSRAQEREEEIADKSNKVVAELLQLEGLTTTQVLECATILTAQPNKLNVFYHCPPSLRKQYVLGLILGASGSS